MARTIVHHALHVLFATAILLAVLATPAAAADVPAGARDALAPVTRMIGTLVAIGIGLGIAIAGAVIVWGAPLPAGHVAFAIAVEPAQAVGGALTPGAIIDVIAVPNALKTLPSEVESAPEATVLGEGLVVLALRSVDGRALTDLATSAQSATSLPPRLGSVVVAVPAAQLPDFASASLTSTMYLALNGQADGERASP